jgi:hypothetical protein
MPNRDAIRAVTLGEIEDYFRSLDFGALNGGQWVQVISIIRTMLQGTRAQLPNSLYWRRMGLGAAIHILSELEKDIATWANRTG